MNPAYNRTLSLLVEISKGPNHPSPDPPPEGRKVPKLFGMKGKHLGSTDPNQQNTTNTSQGRGRNDVADVQAGYLNQAYKPPKKNSVWKKMLGVFIRKFGRNNPK